MLESEHCIECSLQSNETSRVSVFYICFLHFTLSHTSFSCLRWATIDAVLLQMFQRSTEVLELFFQSDWEYIQVMNPDMIHRCNATGFNAITVASIYAVTYASKP